MAQGKVRRVFTKEREYKPLTEKEQLKLQYPNMTIIGYWGQNKNDPEWPWPQDYVDEDQSEFFVDVVANYLNQGAFIEQYRGSSWCRICNCSNGSVELTDGTYVWPNGLAHYVREHKVRLPEEFIQHVIDCLEGV